MSSASPLAVSALLIALTLLLSGCSESPNKAGTATTVGASDQGYLRDRIERIGEQVDTWAEAETIERARVAAEAAANLIVGPNGPGYGDRNRDGQLAGEAETGLLPGIDGTPEGLALPHASNICIARDVLGGSWSEPQAAWDSMEAAIAAWEPGNNTMPTLPSHPMRVVGWATFTLESDSLQEAHEYASHASLHVSISSRALDC